jgi:Fe-S oxidoreductase/FAD/FMN-containing dehydrogenase
MGLTAEQERWLRQRFDNRVSTDLMERKIYSHDVGVMPPLVKPLIGRAVADAVVQPRDENEVLELVRWANEASVPLVPRGKATSGYGGVLPVEGGVTVDFWRMGRFLAVDREALTVTVEPGIVWKNLEDELAKRGLALRLYPSSAPSSTVGGWLAQGGFGYGSFEYGAFSENVVLARVVLPTGEVREFVGDELDLIADAEGITGIITQVSIRVRPLEPEMVVGARFAEVGQLGNAFQTIVEDDLPLWSMSFINPGMARLKNKLPPKLEHGEPVDEPRPQIPEAYIVVFVFPASRAAEIEEPVKRIVQQSGGVLLDSDLAAHEWDERFSIMHVKRLGPSLIPTEVMLPLKALTEALGDIEGSIRLPLVIEGMVAKGAADPQVVLLGFIPHDERTFAYNLAFGLSLSAIEKAKKHGGRAYGSGLYFAHEAGHILGAERIRRLRAFKNEVDLQGVMNPGKVLGRGGLLGTFMQAAGAFEPVIRPIGNLAKVPVGERPEGAGRRGVPDDVAWYAYTCAQCGYCVNPCDQFYGRGWESESPRAKWFFLKEYMAGRAELTQDWVDKFIACTTCELCNVECPLELPNEPSWLTMRGELIHKRGEMTFPPFEIMRASLRKEHNIWGAYRKDRADWAEAGLDQLPEEAEICYFPGCTASYVERDIAQSTACLMHKAGVEFTYLGEDEACCGIPMLMAGLWDTWEEIMRHNIGAMKARGVKTVVTSCPACWLVWKEYYPRWAEKLGIDYPFDARHYSEILAERVRSGDLVFDTPVDMRLTWHDSCHMGRAGGIYEPPRELLRAIPGVEFVEMEHNREEGHCCGSVMSLVADPPAAKRIGDVRLGEAEDVKAEAVVTSCPCCEVQLRVTAEKTGRQLPIIDLGTLVCDAAGIEHPDSTEYALGMWSTFEAMINLLKPQPMADLMTELFPQLVDAMPYGMGGMMRAVGRMPGGGAVLKAMKPLFPTLFPMLMPAMMPDVMPAMLKAVEKRVPMPEQMKEQMPDLMPMAMENLMPKMLPMIVPLISDRLIDYLHEGGEDVR